MVCKLSIYLSLNSPHFLEATFSSSDCLQTQPGENICGWSFGGKCWLAESRWRQCPWAQVCQVCNLFQEWPWTFQALEDFLSSGNVRKCGETWIIYPGRKDVNILVYWLRVLKDFAKQCGIITSNSRKTSRKENIKLSWDHSCYTFPQIILAGNLI